MVYRPQILVVFGKHDADIPDAVIRDLYDRVNTKSIELYSYSDLFEFAKESYESNDVVIIFGQLGENRQEVSSDIDKLKELDRYYNRIQDLRERIKEREEMSDRILDYMSTLDDQSWEWVSSNDDLTEVGIQGLRLEEELSKLLS